MRYTGQRGMVEPRLATGSLGVGRRARDTEYGECVRPLLHDEAGGYRDRFGAKPADCGGARRDADAGESPRNPWVRGAVAFAALGPPPPPLFLRQNLKQRTTALCFTSRFKMLV